MSADPVDAATLAELLETIGDDEAFLAELIETYRVDSPGVIEAMRTAVQTGDAAALRRAAHTLKATSTSMGALGLAEISREVELAAIDGELLAARVEDAAVEYGRVDQALASRVAAGGAG